MAGLDLLKGMIAGRFPAPPITQLLGFDLVEAEEGRAVFAGTPRLPSTTTRSAPCTAATRRRCSTRAWPARCTRHLPKGVGYTTLEFKISLTRAITADTGEVRAEGKVVTAGRRVATSEGRLTDANGRLLAHGTTTCLVFEIGEGVAVSRLVPSLLRGRGRQGATTRAFQARGMHRTTVPSPKRVCGTTSLPLSLEWRGHSAACQHQAEAGKLILVMHAGRISSPAASTCGAY